MAPVIVQDTSSAIGHSGGTDSQAGSFVTLPTAGRCVIVSVFAWSGGSPSLSSSTSVTDNQSNTYTFAVLGPVQSGITNGIWFCPSIGTPSGTFTVTVNGNTVSDALTVLLLEVSGLAASPLGNVAGTTLTNANPHVGSSVTTTVADSLLLALCCQDQGGSATYTPGNSFSTVYTEPDNTTYQSGSTAQRIVTSTGTYNCQWTMSVAGSGTQCVAVFSGVAGAAQDTPELAGRPFGARGRGQMQQLLVM